MKRKDQTNAGFSLVELIIVIAIMAVLVGVLAPQFIKYVENSRRAVDIQNANEIRQAVIAGMADGIITVNMKRKAEEITGLEDILPNGAIPKLKGNVGNPTDRSFWVTVNMNTGICNVYNKDPDSEDEDLCDLTSYAGAEKYRNAGR